MTRPEELDPNVLGLEDLDAAVEERLDDAEGERVRRLLRSPFSFDSWADFVAFRRRHGRKTRPRRRRGFYR